MGRRFLALLVAILLGDATCLAVQRYSTRHPFEKRQGDNQGHGPDYGSPEWQASFNSAVQFRSLIAGAATGLLTFATALSLSPRSYYGPA